MIVHDVPQGETEWSRLRLGIPTASRFDSIITPKTLKPAKGDAYLCELLTAWALGVSLNDGGNPWTRRGNELEAEARNAYAWEYQGGEPVREVGFVTDDAGRYGCSPDGLVGADGLLEIKSPSAKQHVAYMLDPDSLVAAYRCQVQGQLYVMREERTWCDLYSCHYQDRPDLDELPSVRVRCELDDEWVSAFEPALEAFLARLEAGKDRLRALGVDR